MASTELRCGKRLHGILTDDGVLEVACRSALCGHEPGVLVIHRFDSDTGEFLGTTLYKDASQVATRKEQADGLGQRAAVRRP